jgi:hypothetical protein
METAMRAVDTIKSFRVCTIISSLEEKSYIIYIGPLPLPRHTLSTER